MENGSNKSKFEGMFMGANLNGAQIIVVNESGGTVEYHHHADSKDERIHFPLDGTEAQGREVYMLNKKYTTF